MPEDISHRLVIAISSRALFDLSESNQIFENEGIEAYNKYQIARENDILEPGCFNMVKKLLKMNEHAELIESFYCPKTPIPVYVFSAAFNIMVSTSREQPLQTAAIATNTSKHLGQNCLFLPIQAMLTPFMPVALLPFYLHQKHNHATKNWLMVMRYCFLMKQNAFFNSMASAPIGEQQQARTRMWTIQEFLQALHQLQQRFVTTPVQSRPHWSPPARSTRTRDPHFASLECPR